MQSIRQVFAHNLRRQLREHDVRAKDLAAVLGVSPSSVTQWRNGDKFPTPENIEGIADHLGIDIGELFRGLSPLRDGSPALLATDARKAAEILAKALNLKLVSESR